MMSKIVYSVDLIHKRRDEPDFHLYVGIARISDLKPHEEIIEDYLEKLSSIIRKCKFLKNPIIVDLNSNVILDGMHRWHALKRMGFKYIGVCYVDYRDPRVKLRRWFRFLKGRVDVNLLIKELKELRKQGVLEGEWVSIAEVEGLEKGGILLGGYGEVFLPEFDNREKLLYYRSLDSVIEYLSKKFRLKLEYRPDVDLPGAQRLLEEYSVIVAMPTLSKNEVVEVALAGLVYPPKTTRHEIPARPMFMNFPLGLLRKRDADLPALNEHLRKLLRYKNVLYISSGLEIEREYREDIILFWESG